MKKKKINFWRYQIHLCKKNHQTYLPCLKFITPDVSKYKIWFFKKNLRKWLKQNWRQFFAVFFFCATFDIECPLVVKHFLKKVRVSEEKIFLCFVNGWIVKCMSVHLSFRPHFHHAVLTFDWQMKVTPWYFLFLFFRWTTSTWCCSGRSVWFIYVCN